jgi:hypothetical protein
MASNPVLYMLFLIRHGARPRNYTAGKVCPRVAKLSTRGNHAGGIAPTASVWHEIVSAFNPLPQCGRCPTLTSRDLAAIGCLDADRSPGVCGELNPLAG